MSAAQGTPTIFEKIAVALGLGANIGLTPQEVTSVQQGEQRDLTSAEQTVFSLAKPILSVGETQGVADLTTMLKTILGAIPNMTSLGGAMSVVNSVLEAEGSTLQKQSVSLGQTSLTTIVTAILAELGHVNLPLVS